MAPPPVRSAPAPSEFPGEGRSPGRRARAAAFPWRWSGCRCRRHGTPRRPAAAGAPNANTASAPKGCATAASRAESSGWNAAARRTPAGVPRPAPGRSASRRHRRRRRRARLLQQPRQVRGHRRAREPGHCEDEREKRHDAVLGPADPPEAASPTWLVDDGRCSVPSGTRKRLSGRPMAMCARPNEAGARQPTWPPYRRRAASRGARKARDQRDAGDRAARLAAVDAGERRERRLIQPMAMPTPITSQAANNIAAPCAAPSIARPAAKTRLETASTSRPPKRSIRRPARGPRNAERTSPAENAPKTRPVAKPSSRAIGAARIAGR